MGEETKLSRLERRSFLKRSGIAISALAAPKILHAEERAYRRIACEEGFLSPGVLAQNALASSAQVPLITANGPAAFFASLLTDLEGQRLAAMDRDGIDMQLLMLSSPGVQIFERDIAVSLATEANDYVSAACANHPDRLAAFAAIAPQAPDMAALEMQRAANLPGIIGAIVNSHTFDAYLSEERFWPIFEAAEALDLPLYIHPREPVSGMREIFDGPMTSGPTWAYAVETGTHLLKIMEAGVLDRFPKLKLVVGHMGEGIPFFLPRIDNRFQWNERLNGSSGLELLPSEYMRRNVWITTSGMNHWPQLSMAMQVLGEDRVLYATDYPFENQAQAVQAVEAMPFTPSQKSAVFEDNAAALFAV